MAVKILTRKPLTKDWSSDRKYKVQLEDGRYGLLRIAERTAYETKQNFDWFKACLDKTCLWQSH